VNNIQLQPINHEGLLHQTKEIKPELHVKHQYQKVGPKHILAWLRFVLKFGKIDSERINFDS